MSRKLVAISLNEDELKELTSKAEAIDAKSIGTYIKAVAMNDDVPTRRSKVVTIDPVISRQLAWIGNNLNQVAKALNVARKKNHLNSIDYIAALGFISSMQSDIEQIRKTIAERLS